mgnify:FL=1
MVIPCGFLAPEVLTTFDAICQHADCFSTKPTAVGAAVAACLPYGCPYATRVVDGRRASIDAPGTVERCAPGLPLQGQPLVFNLFSMLRAASPDASRHYTGTPDTEEQRISWFEQCLEALSPFVEEGMRIAFPYRIGCGHGRWAGPGTVRK